jgi:hypothetical protein
MQTKKEHHAQGILMMDHISMLKTRQIVLKDGKRLFFTKKNSMAKIISCE